ncbi:MAG TPA: hypothetical protein VNX15_04830, partial [Gemmatimonadales bacterium]|nr:hypothetical protein [Gemmatimonadales bacterium]
LPAPDTVVGLHVQFGGDSLPGRTVRRGGIWAHNPNANELVIQAAALASNGSGVSPNNSGGIIVSGTGGGVHIYGSIVSNTAGFGFAYETPGVRLVGDTALGSAVSGLGIFTGLTTTLSPADSVANSRFSGSGLYPATVPLGALPALYAGSDAWSGNARDTLLMQGGTILGATVTLPRVRGVPWRVLAPLAVGGFGTLNVAMGDSVAFDSTAAIVIGDTSAASGSLHAIGSDTAPILFRATPGVSTWRGLNYLNAVGDTSLRNVTVDGAGFHFVNCSLSLECVTVTNGAIHVAGALTGNLVFDSITVRNSLTFAIDATQQVIPGAVVVRHGQFYGNPFPVLFKAGLGAALQIDSSDIYHYRAGGDSVAILNSNGTLDSVVATDNWWGDVSGPGLVDFGTPDSLGRTELDTGAYGVRYLPFATGPHFPVGGLAAVRAVPESLVFCCNLQAGQALPDSIRVRTVDALGRGVGGQSVTWGAASGSGTVTGSSPTDAGGRVGAVWSVSTVAKLDTATATSGGHNATILVNVSPGPLVSEHWKFLPGLTAGSILPTQDTAIFRASGHVGAVLTSAVDAFGNAVQPSTLEFDSLPAAGFAHNYGIITKLAADTIFFVDTSSIPVPFQLHGVYGLPTGQVNDSVVIISSFVPVGVRLVPDTVVFNSICPTGPGNIFCSRPITAQLFDSSGATLPPNGQILFGDSLLSGSSVTIDSTGGPSLMTTFVTARQPGTTTFLVTQLTGAPLTPATATVTIIAQQVAGQIGVTPDTLSTGLGDTVTFHAAAADSGGTMLVTQPGFQWEVDSIFRAGLVKLDSAGDSLQVRLDSGVYNFPTFDWVAVTRPFTVRAPGDTIFGQGTLHNPLVYNVVGSGISIGTASRAAVDTVTNKTFYTSGGNQTVYVNDNIVNGIVAGITVGFNPSWLAVSHAGGADKVYVSNSSSGAVSVIDAATNVVSATIPLPITASSYGITAADPLGRVYVAARYCPGGPPLCVTQVVILPIDVAGDSVVTGDIVALNTDSLRFPQGLAYNPNNQRLYVAMDSGYVKVVDPVAKAEVGTILVQAGFTLSDVAVNPVTDTVYVSNFGGSSIAVIDPTTGTLVNSLPANTPTGIGVDPRHNRIYYASSGNQSVVEIDGATESYHMLLVGAGGDNPQDAQPDPRTGTVYAPHFTALTALQFYGKPVGALLGAPPFRPFGSTSTRLAPMVRPVTPKAKPAARPVKVQPAPAPVRRTGNAVDNKKALPK